MVVLWREPFESGITRNRMWYFHGNSDRMELHGLTQQRLPLHRRRTNYAIGTTTVDTATEEATMAVAAGVEVVFTLRTGAEVHLVAPTLSLTCHAIAVVLILSVPTGSA